MNETYRVLSLLLAAVADVPEDASVVIIAGPTRLFLPEERAACGLVRAARRDRRHGRHALSAQWLIVQIVSCR